MFRLRRVYCNKFFIIQYFSGYDNNAQAILSSSEHEAEGYVANTDQPAVIPNNYHAQLAQLAHYTDEINYNYNDDNQSYKRSTTNTKRQSNQNREDRYKKFTNIAQRMKSRMASSEQQKPEEKHETQA